jgi:hypothetical protein
MIEYLKPGSASIRVGVIQKKDERRTGTSDIKRGECREHIKPLE